MLSLVDVCRLDSTADVADGSNPAVTAAAAADSVDDVTPRAPLNERNNNSKLSTEATSSPQAEAVTDVQRTQSAHDDVSDMDTSVSGMQEASGEKTQIEVSAHLPHQGGKYRDEELVQCDTCKGMFLRKSLFDHVPVCKKNTGEPLSAGDAIFQCKLCDHRGKWHSTH